MGQYWKVVNLDKREYVDPHKVGAGLKLWEQVANHPGTGTALVILCAAQREVRGGGDLDMDENWHGPERTFPEHNASPGPMPEDYPEIAKAVIGRWAGDRIALVGDYAERSDLPPRFNADLIYDLCEPEETIREAIEYYRKYAEEWNRKDMAKKADRLEKELEEKGPYRDISDMVARVIEHELCGKYVGDGWRTFEFHED
ncbi:MAG: hypothetical protein DRO01_07760 [Thermoproteota archaeon]|nr:MAG: hypothetical protein DRO01_07760 [Candidatus Korarchaeota archaeon]HDH99843.1 hypothetical protein [Bacillota bacterium]